MSAVAEIEVAYVNPPKEGKKMGSIKSKAGDYYWAYPNALEPFKQGMKCQIEYEAKARDDGSEFRTLKKLVGSSHAPSMPKHNYSAAKNPAESKQIAVLTIVKEWVPKIPMGDEEALVHAIEVASRAYDRTLGGVQAQRRDDMDDNIPY